jgi:TorA maturation chaperone TorD
MPAAAIAESLLWQHLAAAFLPPMRAQTAQRFVDDLADDLAQHLEDLNLDAAAELDALREQAAAFTAPDALLCEYSRLFLPPSSVATLNLSRYVDGGGLGGACMDALDLAYEAFGLQPTESLHDFADHAARQFECMAWLCAKGDGSAGDFARLCLVGALPRLAAQLSNEASASPYTPLARLAAMVVARHRLSGAEPAQKPNKRHDLTRGLWRHCAGCGKPYAREKEIRVMALALERAGLPSAHLARCPDCRDRDQGFFRREIA